MAKRNIDLTSKEWRDIVFADKNKDFGAYVMRQESDKRHNRAFIFLIAGIHEVSISIKKVPLGTFFLFYL